MPDDTPARPPKIRKKTRTEHPNKVTRDTIISLVTAGLDVRTICDIMRISKNTVYKYYKAEIEQGRAMSKGRLVHLLHVKAINEGDIRAAIYLLDRLHRMERLRLEVSGPDGKPIQIESDTEAFKAAADKLRQMIEVYAQQNTTGKEDDNGQENDAGKD